jgi:hypothetical protein
VTKERDRSSAIVLSSLFREEDRREEQKSLRRESTLMAWL